MRHTRFAAVVVRRCAVGPQCPMQHNHDLKDKHLAAMRSKLGECLRAQHDLMEPLAPRFVELLQRLDASTLRRETRLYADIGEVVSPLLRSASRKPGE